jgi:hypothetical protein
VPKRTPMTVLGVDCVVESMDVGQSGVPYGALTAYAVFVGTRCIGTVSKIETDSYARAGRLITKTFHPLRWVAHRAGPGTEHHRRVGYQSWTRADAVEGLIRDHQQGAP